MISLKERIIFIGIGQCGGNIASEAAKAGFKAGAINTSSEDLDSENMRHIPHKKVIGKVGGCAKERKLGQKIVKQEYQDIIDFIGTNFLDDSKELAKNGLKKLVYLCFSSSGGTGSGVGPILISVLSKVYKEVTFGAIVVTPSKDESLIAINNSLKCMEELSKLDIPILIPDNNNATSKESRQSLYNSVNSEIVNSILRVVKNRDSSSISNIDEKDKAKMLFKTGVTMIVSTPISNSELTSRESIAKAIENSWSNNVYATINFDKQINIAGFFFEIPEKSSKFIDYNLILSNIGTPLEVFEGIYPTEKETAVVTSVLTGLSFPEKKIIELKSVLEQKAPKVTKSNQKDLFGSSSEFDDLFGDNDDSTSDNLFDGFEDEEESDEEIDIENLFKGF